MTGEGFERPVVWLRGVGSTNDVALEMARSGAPEGEVVAADTQTAGRGRNGRTWVSPPGSGLYASLLLRPCAEAEGLTLLPLLAGLACAEALRALARVEAVLKWPNDVLVGGRKVAGLLVEAEPLGGGSGELALAVGLGVNLTLAAELLPARPLYPATSLQFETACVPGRERLLADWRARMAGGYAEWRGGGHARIRERWMALDAMRGRVVTVSGERADGSISGIDEGIDADGALLVRTASGVRRVLAGDLQVVKGPA